eukprot:GHVU01203372.1.p1 GENE.GHVU01203372.1~~GHVU01203372.1.p1  ORF type:complete len:223 (-),score=20.78 GHVU01203372.1:252-920(-)
MKIPHISMIRGILLFLTVNAWMAKAYKSIGCFNDVQDERVMEGGQTIGSRSAEVCVDLCQLKGYAYAAMENGDRCWCGDAYDRYGLAHRARDCYKKCDDESACGGDEGRLSVYKTDLGLYPPHGAVGCFKDIVNEPVMELASKSKKPFASYNDCIKICTEKGYFFAGIENRNMCYCGNTFDKHGQASGDKACLLRCADGTPCGGQSELMVYRTLAKRSKSKP